MLNPKYRGRVGIPAYGKVANSWLQVLNKTLGGNEDDIDPGIAFLVELMKKNQPLIVEKADAGLKAFAREEIVIMPYWNGRTHVLQSQGVPVEIEYVPGTMSHPPSWHCANGNDRTDPAEPGGSSAESRRQLVPDVPLHHPAVELAGVDIGLSPRLQHLDQRYDGCDRTTSSAFSAHERRGDRRCSA